HHPPVSPPSARDSQDRHSFPTRRSSDLKRDRSRGTPTRPTRPQGQTSNTSARINQATTTPSPRHQRHQPGDSMSAPALKPPFSRSEEHTSELQSRFDLVCRLLLEKKKKT